MRPKRLKNLSDEEIEAVEAWITNEGILSVFWESSSVILKDNGGDIDITIDAIRSDHMFQAVCKLHGINPEKYLKDIRENLKDYQEVE